MGLLVRPHNKERMTHKQIFGAIAGAIFVIAVGVVYSQYQRDEADERLMTGDPSPRTTSEDTIVPAPEKLDDITASIMLQSDDDMAALDAEAQGAIEEIDADTESVNNLGTSYDENSF